MAEILPDKSNGYEAVAERFMHVRSPSIGSAAVHEWSKALPRGGAVLDLGCGHGAPISQVLADHGFALYGIDASAKLIAAFRQRFPLAHAECSAVEDSEFFRRTFEGIVAWGLIFLLAPDAQALVIGKAARALSPGGGFLFTSPREAVRWPDALTGRESISLGVDVYREMLDAEGLILAGEQCDEGDNHYYFVRKP